MVIVFCFLFHWHDLSRNCYSGRVHCCLELGSGHVLNVVLASLLTVSCRATTITTWEEMDVLLRRCPFLARMPQTFLQQTKNSVLGFAQQCPVMMELASKPMPLIMARALCSSSSSSSSPSHPNTEEKMTASEGMWGKDRNLTLK